jgi:hypothetical protein
MKKLLISSLLVLICANIYAQTNVSGGIFSNSTWTLANSPYIMTGPVVVFPNVTLTIEPGVVIKIKELSTNTSEQVYLELRGKLIAKGTSSNPISFIPFQTPSLGTDYIWQGIMVKTVQGGKAEMDHFIFNNSYYGISYDDILLDTLRFNECKFNFNNYALCINTNIELNNCEFKNNGVPHGLMYVYGSMKVNNCLYKNNYSCMSFVSNTVVVEDCTFEENESCFLQISGTFNNCIFRNNKTVFRENGTLYIDSCEFSNNETGINEFGTGSIKNSVFTNNKLGLSVSANSIVENNEILKNDVGLGLVGTFVSGMVLPFIRENKICDNNLYNLENKSDFNLGLERNCFCLSDSTAIDAKIYDGYDDFTRGLINFAVYDSSCNNILKRYIKINLPTTGIENNAMVFTAYPNPFNDNIRVDGFDAEHTWMVFDLTGKKVHEEHTFGQNVELRLNFLDKGVYILYSKNYLPIKIIKL